MTKLCFLDCETTSLRPDRRAWEIGLIIRQAAAPDHEVHLFVRAEDLDLGNADLMSLNVGRYHERHPHGRGDGHVDVPARLRSEAAVMEEVEFVTRGAHLVGAVPNFDADVLAARMRAHGICPSWYYHLIDSETLAVGYLASGGSDRVSGPPWDSDELSAALGVEMDEDERHTALGDARWARAVYDAVMRP